MSKQEAKGHVERIKRLPMGTRVLIIIGQRASEYGIIFRMGRKYVGVELGAGGFWRMPFSYVTDRVDDKDLQTSARLNRGLHGLFGGN